MSCIVGDTARMKQYSRDLRERALRQVDAGRAVGEVAARFGVHRATLLRWRQRRALGEAGPRPRPGRAPPVPVRRVLIRDPEGAFAPQALLCTDLGATPEQALGWFVQRWQLEVTFEEARPNLGV